MSTSKFRKFPEPLDQHSLLERRRPTSTTNPTVIRPVNWNIGGRAGATTTRDGCGGDEHHLRPASFRVNIEAENLFSRASIARSMPARRDTADSPLGSATTDNECRLANAPVASSGIIPNRFSMPEQSRTGCCILTLRREDCAGPNVNSGRRRGP